MRGNRDWFHSRKLAFCVALATTLAIAPGASTQEEQGEIIEYSGDPDEVIVEISQEFEIEDPNPEPLVRVYGDGRMVVHQPVFRKNAGDYETYLTDGEIAGLLTSLSAKGVMNFDHGAARAAKRSAQRSRAAAGELFHRSDGTRTTIKVNLKTYRAAGPGRSTQTDTSTVVSWYGIRSDAKDYPDIPALSDLAAAEEELVTLCVHPALQKVNN